jgi:aryl-alcohol dehydrogenase-like predicted oxidoreductase
VRKTNRDPCFWYLVTDLVDNLSFYGDSEVLLGKWFKRTGKRNEIFLSSKFGIMKSGTFVDERTVDSSAKYCKEACQASLTNLGIDTIDLYYVHRVNFETPIEETMRAMSELKA